MMPDLLTMIVNAANEVNRLYTAERVSAYARDDQQAQLDRLAFPKKCGSRTLTVLERLAIVESVQIVMKGQTDG